MPCSRAPDCNYPYGQNPPCVEATDNFSFMNGARSRHPGGLNTTLADGSVRFIKNSIALNVWQALGSTRGGEIISADSF